MLSVNPETVCFIIDKAHQFHAKEQVVIPEQSLSPTDDWAMQVLADHADDPTFDEAKSTIADLEPDQQVEVVALLWLGRGDYEVEEWENAVADAKDAWNTSVAEYLFAHPQLSDHLQEGLDMLGYSCNE
jgi:hypothetical protein